MFLISSSIVLRHILFGLPLLLYPSGLQFSLLGSSSWMPCAPQGVKEFDDDDDDDDDDELCLAETFNINSSCKGNPPTTS